MNSETNSQGFWEGIFTWLVSYHLRSCYTVDLLQRRESFDFVFFWIARSVAGSVCQIVIFLNAEQWQDISKDTSFSSSIVKVSRFSRFNGAHHLFCLCDFWCLWFHWIWSRYPSLVSQIVIDKLKLVLSLLMSCISWRPITRGRLSSKMENFGNF